MSKAGPTRDAETGDGIDTGVGPAQRLGATTVLGALVVGLVGYYHYCGKLLRDFAAGRNTRSHTWYRVFNEAPVLALFAIVLLAVVKPF